MINKLMNLMTLVVMISSLALVVGCGDDNTTGNELKYNLQEVGNSNVSGTLEFKELTTGEVQAEISLDGTDDGNSHPAHIHMNSAASGGVILVSLDPVDGATGSSVTIISTMDDGTPFTFAMLENINAYVNVHLSATQLQTIVAQVDIGGNALTGERKEYNLDERAVEGISGSVAFQERLNGNVLAVIELEGTPDGGLHPAHIHMNSFTEGGGILVSLNPVDGSTGRSITDITTTDAGEAIDYEDILTLNGYVNVHLSATNLSTIVAQGDIGINELSGVSTTYDLEERAVGGISGEVVFEERLDGTFLATIELDGTPDGGVHPAHIHENSAAEGGSIAVTFNPVDGSTGISRTSIRSLDDGSLLTYERVINYDGYVNVHLSATELATIVAQGDIGINAE